MDDWEEESPSDDDDVTEIENELYSMFYYHSMSEGLPEELSKKYNVDVNGFGATISLKDTTVGKITTDKSNSNDLSLGNDITSSSERYVDRGKGSCQIIPKIINDNDINGQASKELLVKHSNVDRVTKDLPVQKTTTKFQSFRYFSEVNRSKKFVKNNLRSASLKHKFDHFSNEIFHKINLTNTTPVANRSLNNKNVTNKNMNIQRETVIVNTEENNDIIDLTCEPPKKQIKVKTNKKILKRLKNAPVITVSSESETESDEESINTDSISDFEDETFESLMLNTSMPVDKNICDISDINLDYDWKNTSSPEGWTPSMRKFYNKPSKRLLNFDYQDILKDIRDQGQGEWGICNADLYRMKSSRRVRCLRCQQEGHVKANCTKVFSCHMCGTPGHSFKKCPNNICLKCGSKCHGVFPRSCANCANEKNMTCSHCGIIGHSSNLCTAAWHSITSVNEGGSKRNNSRTLPKYCCNCGKSGHYFEDCKKPCYSSHFSGNEVQNPRKAKRVKRSNFKHRNNFEDIDFHSPNNKKSKFKGGGKFRSMMYKAKNHYIQEGHSIRSLKNTKRYVSRRILMLRKTNRKNKVKAPHPSSF